MLTRCRVPPWAGWPTVPRWHITGGNISYLHITKAGSGTIRDYVRKELGGIEYTPAGKPPYRAFVRDPVARFVSGFKEMVFNRGWRGYKDTHGKMIRKLELIQPIFNAFCEEFFSGEIEFNKVFAIHFWKQIHFLCDSFTGQCRRYDYVGNTDTMSTELKLLHPVLGSVNNTKARTVQHSLELKVPPKWIPALCKVYRLDFCCLGFEPPPECPGLCNSLVSDWDTRDHTGEDAWFGRWYRWLPKS
mmetsp:Transcript_3862/g.12085  ORF Transcript_3862/g.12085 Transcript_3862/m.12085 type:complete len:245 (+) Transcript_3862:3-737(+)